MSDEQREGSMKCVRCGEWVMPDAHNCEENIPGDEHEQADRRCAMTANDISYLYEPADAYARAIEAARNAAELDDAVTPYALIAGDALEAIRDGSFVWSQFKEGLDAERKGCFAGEEWLRKYGCIVMPEIMLQVQMVATTYGAPWGAAYIRLREVGRIVERDGRSIWQDAS